MSSILIVADIRLYREGLKVLLGNDNRFAVVDSAVSGNEAIDYLLEATPEAILLDLAMENGLETLQRVAHVAAGTPVIVLAVPDSEPKVLACAEAGAAGYVTRDASFCELVQVIDMALKGELDCSPHLAATMFRRLSDLAVLRDNGAGVDTLSARQAQILALIEKGSSNKEIARVVGIKVATVKNHVHAILDRLHVRCRGEAAAMMRRGPMRPTAE